MQITIREPGSALTHFIAMMMALFAATPLLIKAALSGGPLAMTAMGIFILSMIMLYGASTTYHTLNLSGKALRFFPQNRPHDDFCADCRFLYPGMSNCLRWEARLYTPCCRMGNCTFWHDSENVLDYLS